MIRLANRFDLPKLIDYMKQYAQEANIISLLENQDEEHVRHLFLSAIAGRGFVLIGDHGFLIALINPNVWNPKIRQLSELAWWVEPSKRGGTFGGRLWLEFNRKASAMIDEGRVHIITTSKMGFSPSLDYEKRGYKLLETTYYKEA